MVRANIHGHWGEISHTLNSIINEYCNLGTEWQSKRENEIIYYRSILTKQADYHDHFWSFFQVIAMLVPSTSNQIKHFLANIAVIRTCPKNDYRPRNRSVLHYIHLNLLNDIL